jgi:hypothetical protein
VQGQWTYNGHSIVLRTGGARLRRQADVAMMEPTDFGNLDDRPRGGELGWADVGRILVEREMRASPVIVGEVADEDAAEVPFAEYQDVIETLMSDGADESLRERILPGALRSRQQFSDTHALHALLKHVPIDAVAIAEKVERCAVIRESVDDLLGGQWAVGCSVTLKWMTRRRW